MCVILLPFFSTVDRIQMCPQWILIVFIIFILRFLNVMCNTLLQSDALIEYYHNTTYFFDFI